jgi:hypothetical protein
MSGRVGKLLAVLVVALIAVPTASAAANNSTSASAASKIPRQSTAVRKQIAALKRQMATLTALEAELQGQVAALQAQITSFAPMKIPASLPPSGPAGGALTGNYPNPMLAENTVREGNILDGTVGSDDVKNEAITSTDIGDIGALNLKNTAFRASTESVPVPPGETRQVTVTCPEESRLLSGGWEWTSPGRRESAILFSGPALSDPEHTWEVVGRVDRPLEIETENGLLAEALCLPK